MWNPVCLCSQVTTYTNKQPSTGHQYWIACLCLHSSFCQALLFKVPGADTTNRRTDGTWCGNATPRSSEGGDLLTMARVPDTVQIPHEHSIFTIKSLGEITSIKSLQQSFVYVLLWPAGSPMGLTTERVNALHQPNTAFYIQQQATTWKFSFQDNSSLVCFVLVCL